MLAGFELFNEAKVLRNTKKLHRVIMGYTAKIIYGSPSTNITKNLSIIEIIGIRSTRISEPLASEIL